MKTELDMLLVELETPSAPLTHKKADELVAEEAETMHHDEIASIFRMNG